MTASREFWKLAPSALSNYNKMSDPEKESFLEKFVKNPRGEKGLLKVSWDDKKKEYVYKETYSFNP